MEWSRAELPKIILGEQVNPHDPGREGESWEVISFLNPLKESPRGAYNTVFPSSHPHSDSFLPTKLLQGRLALAVDTGAAPCAGAARCSLRSAQPVSANLPPVARLPLLLTAPGVQQLGAEGRATARESPQQ